MNGKGARCVRVAEGREILQLSLISFGFWTLDGCQQKNAMDGQTIQKISRQKGKREYGCDDDDIPNSLALLAATLSHP